MDKGDPGRPTAPPATAAAAAAAAIMPWGVDVDVDEEPPSDALDAMPSEPPPTGNSVRPGGGVCKHHTHTIAVPYKTARWI